MFLEILNSPIFWSATASAATAQVIKTILDYIEHKEFHWQSLVRGAGMPSSHTALVVALAISVYFVEGMSTLFIITFFFSTIVVRDVMGDKVFATHQETLINKLINQLVGHEKVEWRHLIGHTITEVIAGIILAVTVTAAVFYLM